MSQKLWPLAAIALALASSATGVAGDACYGQTPGAIVCANLRSYYTCGYNAAGSTLTTLPVAQKCCNNQIVASNDPACGAVCGNGAVDGTVVCVGQTMFVTCSYQSPLVVSMACPSGTVCCPNGGGVSACRFIWECAQGYSYTPTPTTTTTTYIPAPTYSGTYAPCSGKLDGTLVCTSGTTLNYCLGGGLASTSDQSCPVGLVCCPNLGRCDVPGCKQTAPSSCSGVGDGNIVCKSATTFNMCQYGAEVNSADQSCQPGLVCCQGLNRCDVPGCANPSYAPPPTYNPGVPVVPTGTCAGKPDNYVLCTSATTFNICKNGIKPYGDQTCQAGLICCEGSQRCDTTCAADYTPPAPVTQPPVYVPPVYVPPAYVPTPNGACASKPDGYMVCQSKTTLNYCLSGALVKAADQSCPPGLECCEGQQACGYPGCNYSPAPQSCANVKDNQIVCKSLTTFNICSGGKEAAAVAQHCPATTVCCANLNRCDVVGCSGTASPVPPISPPPSPPYNPNPNPAGCTGKVDNQIVCRSATTFNICHGGGFSGLDQNCPANLVCCDNLNRCDWNGCKGTPSPIPKDPPTSGPYNPTPPVQNTGGSCDGKNDGYVTCTSPNTFNICSNGAKASTFDQYCPSGLTCCETTQSCESNCPAYVPPTPPPVNCNGQPDGKMLCLGGNSFTLCQSGLTTPSQVCPSGLVCCGEKGKCDYPGCSTTPYVPPNPNIPVYVPPTINCSGVKDGMIRCTSATSFRICQSGKPASSVDLTCQPGLFCCENLNACDVAGCQSSSYIPSTPIPYNPSDCQNVKDGNIYCTSQTTFNICQNGLPVSSSSQKCPPGLVCCASTNRCDVAGCPATYGSVVPASSSGGYLIHAPVVTGLKVATGQSITKCDCSGQPDNRLKCTSPTTFNFCYGQSPVAAYDQSCPAGLTCCEATQRCDTSCYSAPPAYVDPPPPYTPSVSLCTGQANNAVVCTGQSTFNICWNQTMASAVDQSCPYGQVCCSNTGRCDDSSCPSTVTTYVPPPSCKGKKDNQIFCTGSNTFKYCVNQQIYTSTDITCPAGLVCCDGLNRCDVDGCPGSTPKYTPPTPPSYIPPAPYTPTCSGALDGSIVCRSKTTFNFCSGGTFIDAADQYCPYGTVCCAETNLCDYAANCGYALPAPTIPSLPAPSCSKIADGGIACISLYQFRYCSKGAFIPSSTQSCAPGTVCCANSNKCDYLSNCKSVYPVAPPVTVPQYTLPSNICAGLPDNHVACVNTNSFSLCLNQMPSTGVQNCAAGTVCCGNACVYPDDPACGGNPLNPCAQIPDGQMACSDVAKYVLCQNKSPITPSMPCAPGTVCCGNACVFSTDPMCATTPGPNCAPNTYLPPPVYNPPSVVPTTPAGICTGVPDNNIVCTSAKSFNFCLGQSILPKTADQYCPAGTYCCQSLQRCTWYGECPVKPNVPYLPEPCNGLPDNAQLCVSATQFNLCWKGQFTTAVPQSCAFGTVCCADSNKCLPQSQCLSQLPKPSVDPNGVQLLPIANVPTDYCDGVADGKMACVNPTYYAFCKSGLPVVGLKACPAGQVCCGNSCVDPKSALCQSCAGCKDNTISCTSDTQYTICKGGLSYTPPVSCPSGTYCCGNACVAASHPMCARPPSYTPPVITPPTPPTPATPPVPYKSGSCTGCSDNLIRCRSKSSFNYCLNQMYLSSPDFSCPEGTVCCADTNICDWEYNCKKILDPLCKGMPNGATICIGSTAFKTCSSGDFLPGMTTCPAGQVCSQSTNKCEATSSFKTYSYLLEKPSDVPTNFDMSASNVCAGVPDSNIACINPSQFSICLGGLPTAAQSCAPGTKCCGNACVFPSNANCGVNICSGVPDSSIACVSSSTYSTCLNGLAITPPMPCPAGTVCCGNACVFSSDPLCANGGVLYSPPPNPYVPPKAITPPPYCPVDYVPGTYTPPATNPCSKVPDMQIVCRSANTFNFCLNQQLVSALDQYCAPGTVCCSGSTPNVCGKPGDCPTTAKAQVCANMANNQILCVSKTEFNICQNGVFASYAPQSCPLGTICCADKNQCLQPEACSAVLPPPYTAPPPSYKPPSTPVNICAGIPDGGTACVNPASIAICKGGSPVYGTLPCPLGTVCSGNQCVSSSNPAYSNVCAGVPDSAIACTSASQFVTCLHSSIYSAPLNCPAGTVCCGGACTYSTDPLCAGAKPYVPSSRPVETATAPPAYTITSQYSAVYSTKVAPSPTPKYTPVPTYSNVCAGVPDTGIACLNTLQFVSCMNNAVYTAPLSCQPGTVCCGNACRFPSDPVCAVAPKVPTYTGPTASVVSTSTPYYSATTVTYSGTPTATSTTAPTYAAPSPSPAPVYNNCVGVADYQPSCTGPSSFKYCVSNSYVSNQTSIACSPGMVCCPSTGLCDKKENCGSSGTTTSVYPSGACTSGSSSMFCTSSSTYTLCTKDGPSFTGMKCAAGTVCCPTTNTCDFAYNCPALGTALTTKSSSSVDECIGAPDGRMCSSDQLSLLDCQGGSTATERDCSTDGNNFCCDSTRSCSPMDGCPSLCKDNVGVDARCRSAVSLVICVNESIGESISCGDSGQICCGNTGACTAPEDC